MRKIAIFAGILFLVGAMAGTPSFAVLPTLQLGIQDGYYFGDTTYNTTNPFTLRALYNGDGDLYDKFFILSIAVVPSLEEITPQPELGTFRLTYDGTPYDYDVTGDMLYGKPPIATIDDGPPGDLAGHGVFDTYFLEFQFKFDPTSTVAAYNVQDGTSAPGTLAYRDFVIDYAGLDVDYHLHFDLYNLKLSRSGKYIIDQFAPFSHDAETNGVPEAGALLMFGTGLIGLVGYRRVRRMQ